MIDIKLKYGALVFLNTSDILPTPDTVSGLITLFRDKELIPSIAGQEFRMFGGVIPQQVRIKLSNTTSEWSIAFSENRIDVEQMPTDPKGENLGEIETFSEIASDLIKRVMEKFKKQASRIGINSNCILNEMTEDALNQAYNKLFAPPEYFQTNKPFEWDWRAVSRVPITIIDIDDSMNVIATLKRVRGQLESIPLERLNLLLDLNTSDLNSETRFDSTHVNAFLAATVNTHQSLVKEFEEYING